MDLDLMTSTALRGESITREQALEVLACPDDQVFQLVAAVGKVRRKFFGNTVKLNYLINLKSGLCSEDCTYCSQRLGSRADIVKYSWLDPAEVRTAVEAGIAGGARKVCMVAAGYGPSKRDVERVNEMVREVKTNHPSVEVCVCLGFVDDEKAASLKAAGADTYNHNLNTSESNYGKVCNTHSYSDRRNTLEVLKANELSPCSGMIAGMGESAEELVEVVFALREAGADSIPVNFLMPFDGTPLKNAGADLTPLGCLRILAMVRLVNPDKEIRAAAGREMHLRSLQPVALEIVNSIFLGDYLTSEGQAGAADLAMIEDAGFVLIGATPDAAHAKVDSQVPIRHRGVGTKVPANV